MRRVGLKPATTKPQGDPMLKRIALAAVLVVSAAFVGASIAKAKAPQIPVAPDAPRGFCMPPATHC
jgi:hypothetical protein